jgi:hypothetical protein
MSAFMLEAGIAFGAISFALPKRKKGVSPGRSPFGQGKATLVAW